MRKLKVFIIVVGILLVLAGGGLLTYSIVKTNEFNGELKTVSKEITGELTDIDINLSEASWTVKRSPDNRCVVEFLETEKFKYEAKVEGGKLIVTDNDTRQWYERYFLNFGLLNMKATVYLPETNYNEVHIKESTGSTNISGGFEFRKLTCESTTGQIVIDDITVIGNIIVQESTGAVVINNTRSKNLKVDMSTGSVGLKNYIAGLNIEINTSTGAVVFDMCDAATLIVSSSTGSVKGTLLTPKIFNAKSTTGSVKVPTNTTGEGGLCTITTTTGSINIEIKSA